LNGRIIERFKYLNVLSYTWTKERF
jgi:hypothetical protein